MYTATILLPAKYWHQDAAVFADSLLGSFRGIFHRRRKDAFPSDDGESLYQIPDNIYIADITEVPFTGLVDVW